MDEPFRLDRDLQRRWLEQMRAVYPAAAYSLTEGEEHIDLATARTCNISRKPAYAIRA
jgi:hypothetical protein